MGFGALAARGQSKAITTTPAAAVIVPDVSPVHGAVLAAFDQLLEHVGQAEGLPSTARMMLGALRSSSGMMRDSLARMPEEQLRGMLVQLRDRITDALDGPPAPPVLRPLAPGHYDGDGCTFPAPGHFAPVVDVPDGE